MLYIVATPIGNLRDITLRALDILKSVDLIAAEDTRQTLKLTRTYSIKTPITSYFEHNKNSKGEYLLRLLKEGKQIALVSDSGTPGISDPGFHIIRLAKENNIPITAVPGPTAVITALILSGAPMNKFVFEGFLSAKRNARVNRLAQLRNEDRSIVIYEAPHRIIELLKDISEVFGDVEIVIARELTKKFEEIIKNKTHELIKHFGLKRPRGEFVVIIPPPANNDMS